MSIRLIPITLPGLPDLLNFATTQHWHTVTVMVPIHVGRVAGDWLWFGGAWGTLLPTGLALFLDRWGNLHFHQVVDHAADLLQEGQDTYAVDVGLERARKTLRFVAWNAAASMLSVLVWDDRLPRSLLDRGRGAIRCHCSRCIRSGHRQAGTLNLWLSCRLHIWH